MKQDTSIPGFLAGCIENSDPVGTEILQVFCERYRDDIKTIEEGLAGSKDAAERTQYLEAQLQLTEKLSGVLDGAHQKVREAIEANLSLEEQNIRIAQECLSMLRSGPSATETASQTHAREIMGHNYVSTEQMERYFGVEYAPEQRAALQTIPFSAEVLERCKDTHILVPGAPVSIAQTREKNKELFYKGTDNTYTPWYASEDFVTEEMDIRWHLLRKEAVPGSAGPEMTYAKQVEHVKDTLPGEEVAHAKNLIPAIFAHYHAIKESKGEENAEKLFTDFWVRCQEQDSGGGRVYVRFDSDGFCVRSVPGGSASDGLAVASALEVPEP